MKFIIDVIGWVGSAEVIAAYALNSYQRIRSDSMLFQVLNLTGGLFLILNTVYYGAYPSTVINVVWVAVSGIALISIFRKRKING